MSTIFLAGAEVEKATEALLENGVRNILYSFFYILTWNKEGWLGEVLRKNPQVRFFLDSGAFTYAQAFESNPKKLPPQREYLRDYLNFIELYGEHFVRIAEPDFDSSGMEVEEVDAIREGMLERWPHLKIIPVFHPWRGNEAWENYCRDPRVKAMGIGMGDYTLGELRRLVMRAHMHGKPVHGFGMTRIASTARVVPFDSIDSISWVAGQKFGVTYLFQGNKFTTLTIKNRGKERRKLYKKYYEAIGCDFAKILADDVEEVRKSNIIAWRNLSARMEEMRKREGRSFMEEAGEKLDAPSALEVVGDRFEVEAKPREQITPPRWETLHRGSDEVRLGYEARDRYTLNEHKRPRERTAAGEAMPRGARQRAT